MGFARSDDAAVRVARRTLGAFALVGTTAVVWFGFVDPAGADAPTVKANCVGGQSVLTVEIRGYDSRVANTVTVLDGGRVLDGERFGSSYRNSFIRPGNAAHSYRVGVRAGNDRTGDQGFSFDRTVSQPPCEQVAPTPTRRSTTSPPSSTTTATRTSAPKTTSTAPTTTTHTTTPPVTTTTTAAVTTTTPAVPEPPVEQPGRGTEPPGRNGPTSTALPTSALPSLAPPLVSLVEPPTARTSVGSETPPGSRTSAVTSTSSSVPGDGRGPVGGETRGTTSERAAGTTTSEDGVLVVADDTDLPTTGASIAIPLLFGLCVLTAGGVVVFSTRNPRKRGRHAA